MIYLDANVFLRYLTKGDEPHLRELNRLATELFNAIEVGTLEATTSEVALHQAMYFLISKQHYAVPSAIAVETMQIVLAFKGFKFAISEREVLYRALDILASRPSLGFADAVIVARCEANNWVLATFDEQLGTLPGITRWQTGESSAG